MIEDLRLVAAGGSYAQSSATYFSATATTLTVNGLPANVTEYHYRDFGASYFTGTYYYEGTIAVTAMTGAGNKVVTSVFDDVLSGDDGLGNKLGLALYNTAITGAQVYLRLVESGVDNSPWSGYTHPVGTTLYYRVGSYTALGRYGGAAVQIFSDAAMTTLVGSASKQRTASTAHRYFQPATSFPSTSADTISTTYQNITLTKSASVGLDLTTFTNALATHVTPYADCVVCSGVPNSESDYLYKDFGVNYFAGNYRLRGVLNFTSETQTTSGTVAQILSLSNVVGDASGTSNMQYVGVVGVNTTTYYIYGGEKSGTTELQSAASSTLNIGTPYWLEISRDTTVGTYGTLYVKIFNDPAYTTQVGSTLTVTLRGSVSFRYFYALQAQSNSAAANTYAFTIGGVSASLPINLLANGVNKAAGTAAITTSISLSSAALNRVSATANLTTSILLSGNAVNLVTAFADLFGGARLYANAKNVSIGTASLSTAMFLAGNAVNVNSIVTALSNVSVIEKIYARFRDQTTGLGITGSVLVKLIIMQQVTDLFYDFTTKTFKSSAIPAPMNETSATIVAGVYGALIDVAAFPDGKYAYFVEYGGSPAQGAGGEFITKGGVVVTAATAVASTAPTTAQIAAATRTNLTAELALIDVAISSRLPTSGYTAPDNTTVAAISGRLPAALVGGKMAIDTTNISTPAQIAAATRTNLTAELALIDVAISSRLPTSGYTAPDNTTVAAISGRLPAALVGGNMAIDTTNISTPAQIAAAVGLRAITATLTADQSQRVTNAVLFGKVSGAGTATETFRNPEDTKNVCTITVDASGNRTLVVVDAT